MGILDSVFSSFSSLGAQVNQTVLSAQPTTTSGAPYSQPAQQQASTPAIETFNPVAALQSGYNTYVAPAVQTVQQITRPAIDTFVSAAPTLVPPVAIGVAALSVISPQRNTPTYQGLDLGVPQPVATPVRAETYTPTFYERSALQTVESRAGYTPISQLGDTRTQAALKGLEIARGLGFNVATQETFTGRVLEAQREAAATPKAQQYYTGELSKWAENMVELGSAYHVVGKVAETPIPANRYEYQGDLAVEFLKGTPTKASEYFSPVSGEMSKSLPGGVGLQQSAWEVAKTGKTSTLNYSVAVEKLSSAAGQYGPYGKLWGGPEYKETGVNSKQYVTPTSVAIQTQSKVLGSFPDVSVVGLPTPFKSTSQSASSEEYKPSGLFGLGGLFPEITREKASAYLIASKSAPLEATLGTLGTGLEGAYSAAAGGINAVIRGVTFGIVPTVFKTEPIVIKGTPYKYSESISTSIAGGSEEASKLGLEIESGRKSLDLYNPTAVAEFNKKVDVYNALQKANPVVEKTTTTKTPIPGTGVDDKVYASEWDRFVEGSGRVSRNLFGFSEAKYTAYGETIKSEPGVKGVWDRTVYEVGGVIANRPASLAPDVISGTTFLFGGEFVGAGIAGVAAGTGRVSSAAQWIMSPTGQTVVKAGAASFFGTLYTLNVTEGFKATSQETERNIERSILPLAAMYAGGGGFNRLPEVGLEGLRAAERVLPDIQQSRVRGQPVVVAGPQFAITNVKGLKDFVEPREVSGATRLESGKMSETTPIEPRVYKPQFKLGDYTPLPGMRGATSPAMPEPIGSAKLKTLAPSVERIAPETTTVKKVFPIRGETARTGLGEYTPLPGIFPAKITSPALPEMFRGKIEEVSFKTTVKSPEYVPSGSTGMTPLKFETSIPTLDLTKATMITQVGKAKMIETITPAEMRQIKTTGTTRTERSIGMQRFARESGRVAAKETAFEMKTQRLLPSVAGVADTAFGSTATIGQRSVNSLRDAYQRSYPAMEMVVKQDIAQTSVSGGIRAAYPISDIAVRQGVAPALIQTTKTHMASMEEAKTSIGAQQEPSLQNQLPSERSLYTPIKWASEKPVSKESPMVSPIEKYLSPEPVKETAKERAREREREKYYGVPEITKEKIPGIEPPRERETTRDTTRETPKETTKERPFVPIPPALLLSGQPDGGGAGGYKAPFRRIQREILYIGPSGKLPKVKMPKRKR
jgi:hypothetical protein